MNRRRSFGELASSFPFGAIDALQSLIDKPNITIDVNGPIEPFPKQHQLVPSQLHLRKSHHPLPGPPNLPKNQNQNQARHPLNRQAVTPEAKCCRCSAACREEAVVGVGLAVVGVAVSRSLNR